MKILLFIRSLDVGGSQRQLALLASGLAGRGHDVIIVVLYRGGVYEERVAAAGVRIVDVGKAARWDLAGPLARLRKIVRTEQPDLVYSFLPTQNVLAALLVRPKRGTKLVFGLRSAGMPTGDPDRVSAIIYRMEARLSKRADLIVANSDAGKADAIARGMPMERLLVIPNGIDINSMRLDPARGEAFRKAWNVPDNALVIGMVARLDPMKDHETFLSAAAIFQTSCPDARFVLVGGGSDRYRAALVERAAALGILEKVTWTGSGHDVAAAFNAFDVATLSSAYGEAFPNAVAEAMACGRLIAATDVGDVRGIVGRFGEIVPPRKPELLSAAWKRLRERIARDPAVRDGARARIIENYSVEAMVMRTETALGDLLSDGQ